MFARFNLETSNDYDNWYEYGKEIFDKKKKIIRKDLGNFVGIDGSIDGTKMQQSWFPDINADIFISHSHSDKKKAIGLAGWLNKNFGLNVFIDSCVWGYSNELLKIIDDEYCKNTDNISYNYDKRNYSTSHVHMMLSTALSMMIDKTECLFFLNTPNSITTKDVIGNTKSPWIYSELATAELVRNRPLEHYRMGKIQKKAFIMEEKKELTIEYNVRLEKLIKINQNDLNNWKSIYDNNKLPKFSLDTISTSYTDYPLDVLYNIKSLITKC